MVSSIRVGSNTSSPGVDVRRDGNTSIVAFVGFVLLSIPAFADESLAFLSVQAPLIFIVCVHQYRLLQIAVWVGCCLTWLGSVGSVGYLGISSVKAEIFQSAVQFSLVLSVSIFALSFKSKIDVSSVGVRTSTKVHRWMLVFGCSLLAVRLSSGIPLLAGNDVRLENVLTTSPVMGVLLGSVVITAAFLKSPVTTSIGLLQVLLAVMAVGTASRLLVVAVLLGIATGYVSEISEKFSVPTWVVGASVSLTCIAASVLVYSFRTDTRTQGLNAQKTSDIGGFADVFNNWFGSSLFLSSRNGLVVAGIVEDRGLHPPLGFIFGGLSKSTGLASSIDDPERWLTGALGLTVRSVGAIATPIWSGANADFGAWGSLIFALAMGICVTVLCRVIVGSEVWISIAIVFSFYGSYLVSAQFIGATILMGLCYRFTRRKSII